MTKEKLSTGYLEKIAEFSQRIMEPSGMLIVTAMSGNREVKIAMEALIKLSQDMDDYYNENI